MLDLRHLGAERIIERLPGSRELAMTYAGVDPIYDPIPVRPGAHYHMGGVETDNDGLTELTGLYAAGEVACVSVHGANRLGGNSLMETITFGRRAGRPPPSGRSRTRRSTCRRAAERDAERELSELLDRTTAASARGRSATSSASRCSRTSASSAARTDGEQHRRILGELRERVRPHVFVEDKGDVFNTDLTQAIELGYTARHSRVHGARRGSRARRAAAPTRAPSRLPDARRRELHEALDLALGRRRPQLSYVRVDEWEPT